MKLEYFYIKGYRRIKEAKVMCGDATFLIGENNIGKSSILKALECFFSETSKLNDQDFFSAPECDHVTDEVLLEAKLIELPEEAHKWPYFRGRVIREEIAGKQVNCIYYRKKFFKNGAAMIREMKKHNLKLKDEFNACKKLEDFVAAGISEDRIIEVFGDTDRSRALPKAELHKLEAIHEIWEELEGESTWTINPGGIEGNISIRLPRFLLIPAENRKEEIEGTNGTLQQTMRELFNDVRDNSDNYKEAQKYLNKLAAELDPEDAAKEFGKMLVDVNKIISGVFSNSRIHIGTNLSDPSSTIKPTFDIEMSSNVKTKPERQGMGAVRSTVFALLRYREEFVQRKRAEGVELRPLIIGFEEPEMYLHPNAAALMRDKIYELATSSNSKIICTTHSPYMIDLSKKIDDHDYPKQVLNLLKLEWDHEMNCDTTRLIAFNTTAAYKGLQADERNYIKFLLKVDDYVAKVFFCKKVIIVEGDTEDLLLKETVNRLSEEKRKLFLTNYQVVKARGKAAIISFVKYLKAMSISPFVIHDEDEEAGAVKFNIPILAALDNDVAKRLLIEKNIEQILGYEEPSGDKPYKAYHHIQNNWQDGWEGIQENWRMMFQDKIAPELFSEQ